MTRLDCCPHLRHTSLNEELPNSRAVSLFEQLPRRGGGGALISNNITPTSSRSAGDLQPIRHIFASSSLEEPDPSERQRYTDQGYRYRPKRAMLFSARRREGNRKLRELARILRHRLSRESDVSKKSSRKKSRSDPSEEEIERRKELKRALHRRLEEELLQDRTSSEGGYDADAIPIKTPNGTWSRTGGSGRYNSTRLRPEVGRFESPSPSPGRGLDQRQLHSQHGGPHHASASMKDRRSEQSDQGLVLQRALGIHSSEDRYIPTTDENQPQTFRHRQSNSTGQRFERPYLNSHQIEHEDAPKVHHKPKLYLSRSASFFDFAPFRSRTNVMANRRRSMQSIIRNSDRTDSASNTRDVGTLNEQPHKLIRGPSDLLTPYAEIEDALYHFDPQDATHPSHEIRRDAEIEQTAITGFDGVDDSEKNRDYPAGVPKAISRRSVSFSMDPVRDTQSAPHEVSKLLVPSKSLSELEMHARRQQVSDDNGSPTLHHVKTRHKRRKSSSGFAHLKVPDALSQPQRDLASSNYSSYNDSLASSRRSSLKKLQSLSERLDVIKNDTKGTDSSLIWIRDTNIPRAPSSQIIIAEIDDTGIRTLEAGRRYTSAPIVSAPESTAGGSRRPSLQHSSDFSRRSGYASKRERSEGRSSFNIEGNDERYRSSSRQGRGYDIENLLNDDASSVWGKAFQSHAEKRLSRSKTRPGNVSPAPSRQSLEKRLQVSETPTRPRLQRGKQFTSNEFWKKHLHPKYRVDLDQPDRIDASKPGNGVFLKNTPPGPAASWSRFPSHTRAERSFSPAGETDKVAAQDFAPAFETMEAPNGSKGRKLFGLGKKRKSRTMAYGENVMTTLNRIYNIDLRRSNRGHRSSISVGGKLEYPELEILPYLSAPPQPLDEVSKRDTAMVLEAFRRSNSSRPSIVQEPDPHNEPIVSASTWSKMYEDCVRDPADLDKSLVTDTSSEVSCAPAASASPGEQEKGQFSSRSSPEMRASTLDFQRTLQDDKARAQERALQAAENAWGVSTPSFRSSRWK